MAGVADIQVIQQSCIKCFSCYTDPEFTPMREKNEWEGELRDKKTMKTEAETRKELIDTKRLAAGWDVNNLAQVTKEFDINVPLPEGVAEPRTPYEGHQYSDYVLLGRDDKPPIILARLKNSEYEIEKEMSKLEEML